MTKAKWPQPKIAIILPMKSYNQSLNILQLTETNKSSLKIKIIWVTNSQQENFRCYYFRKGNIIYFILFIQMISFLHWLSHKKKKKTLKNSLFLRKLPYVIIRIKHFSL